MSRVFTQLLVIVSPETIFSGSPGGVTGSWRWTKPSLSGCPGAGTSSAAGAAGTCACGCAPDGAAVASSVRVWARCRVSCSWIAIRSSTVRGATSIWLSTRRTPGTLASSPASSLAASSATLPVRVATPLSTSACST